MSDTASFLARVGIEIDPGNIEASIASIRTAIESLSDLARRPAAGGTTTADLIGQLEEMRSAVESALTGVGDAAASRIRDAMQQMISGIRSASTEAIGAVTGPGAVGARAAANVRPRDPATGQFISAAAAGPGEAAVDADRLRAKQEAAVAAGESATEIKKQADSAKQSTRLSLDEIEERNRLARDLAQDRQDILTKGVADRRLAAEQARAYKLSPAGRTEAAQTEIANIKGLPTAETETGTTYPQLQAQLKTAYQELAARINQELLGYDQYLKSFVELSQSRSLLAAAERQELALSPDALAAAALDKVATERLAAAKDRALSTQDIGEIGTARAERQGVAAQIKGATLGIDPEQLAQMDPLTRQSVIALQQQRDKLEASNAALQAIVDGDTGIPELQARNKALRQQANENLAKVAAAAGGGAGAEPPGAPPSPGGPIYPRRGGGYGLVTGAGGGLGSALAAFDPANLLQFAAFNLQFAAFNLFQRTITDSVTSAIQLERQLQLVQARADAIGQGGQFASLRDNILQTSASTGVAADQVATLANEFLGLYGNVTQANQATTSAAELIRVMGVSAAQAGPEIAAMAEDFGAPVQDIGNNIIDAANKTGRAFSDIAAGMASISPEAKVLGVNLNETRGIIEAVGATSALSGQQIGQLVARLLPELQGKLVQLAELGVRFSPAAAAGDAAAQLKDLISQYPQLSQAAQAQIPALVGGPRQAQIVAALAADPQKTIDAMNSSVSSNTLLADANRKVQDSLAGAFDRLKASLVAVGEAFLHSGIIQGVTLIVSLIGDLIKALTPILSMIGTLNDELGGVPGRIIGVVAALTLMVKAIQAASGLRAGLTGLAGRLVGAAAGGAPEAVAETVAPAAGGLGGGVLGGLAGIFGPTGGLLQTGTAGLGGAALGVLTNPATIAAAAAVAAGVVIKNDFQNYSKSVNTYRQQISGSLTDQLKSETTAAEKEFEDQVKKGQAGQAAPDLTTRPGAPSTFRGIEGALTGTPSKQQTFDRAQQLKDQNNQRILAYGQAIQAAEKENALSEKQLNELINAPFQAAAASQAAQGQPVTALVDVNSTIAGALQGKADDIKKLNEIAKPLLNDPKLGPIFQHFLGIVNQQKQEAATKKTGEDISTGMTKIAQGISDSTGQQLNTVQDIVGAYQSGDITYAQAATAVQADVSLVEAAGGGRTQPGAQALKAAQKFFSDHLVKLVTDQITFQRDILGEGPDADLASLQAALTGPESSQLTTTARDDLTKQFEKAQNATYLAAIGRATNMDQLNQLMKQGYQLDLGAADLLNQQAEETSQNLPFAGLAAQEAALKPQMDALKRTLQTHGETASRADLEAAVGIQAPTTIGGAPGAEALAKQAQAIADMQVAQAKAQGQSAVQQSDITIAGDKNVLNILNTALAAATTPAEQAQLNYDIAQANTKLSTDQAQRAQNVLAQIQAQGQFFQALNKYNPVAAAQAGLDTVNKEIAKSPYGNINKIMADIRAGTASTEEAGLGTQYIQASQAQTDAANQLADAQGQYAADIAKASGDTIGAARADVARIQGDIARLAAQGGAGTAAYVQLQDQLFQANIALVTAQNAVLDAQINYSAALAQAAGDPVRAGQFKIQALQVQIAQLRQQGATEANSPQLLGLLGQLAVAQSDQISTFINTAVTQTQNSLDLRRIGVGQAIANMEATLQQAAAMGANQTQLDDLQKQINSLIQQTQGNLNWNLGQIQVPTLYQARRLEATGASGYQDNRTQAINITVNNAQDMPGAVNTLLDAVGGPSRTGTQVPVLSAL